MNKMAWFDNYERLYNERDAGEIDEDITDEDLSEMASEQERDQMADLADIAHDVEKHGEAAYRKANDPRGRHL